MEAELSTENEWRFMDWMSRLCATRLWRTYLPFTQTRMLEKRGKSFPRSHFQHGFVILARPA